MQYNELEKQLRDIITKSDKLFIVSIPDNSSFFPITLLKTRLYILKRDLITSLVPLKYGNELFVYATTSRLKTSSEYMDLFIQKATEYEQNVHFKLF